MKTVDKFDNVKNSPQSHKRQTNHNTHGSPHIDNVIHRENPEDTINNNSNDPFRETMIPSYHIQSTYLVENLIA